MGFRASTPNCWSRIRGKNLTKDAFILALFVELYPAAHYSGIYSLPFIDIQENTGLAEGEISAAMDELEKAGLAIFDRTRMLVFVPGMMLRQLGVKKINAKQVKGIFVHLEGFSKSSPTVSAFLKDYGLTLPDTPADTPMAYPHGIPVSDRGMAYNLRPEPEPDREKRDLRPTASDTLPLEPLGGSTDRAPGEGEVDDPDVRAATLKFLKDAGRKIGGPADGNGEGVSKGKSPRDEFIDDLVDPAKRTALTNVLVQVDTGKMNVEDAMLQLEEHGFTVLELDGAEAFLAAGAKA